VEYIQVNPYDDFMENFKNKVNLSVIKHKSRGIVVFGHQDCLGNPVEDNVHKNDVLRSAGFIKSLVSDIDVIPVFVVQKEKSWEVEEL
jgi:hypothetical protein